MIGETTDKAKVFSLKRRYGELDGKMSALYAARFAEVNKTLTAIQRQKLVTLRNLNVVPGGAYLYSTPIPMPTITGTDYFFGVGTIPSTAGKVSAPTDFGFQSRQSPQK